MKFVRSLIKNIFLKDNFLCKVRYLKNEKKEIKNPQNCRNVINSLKNTHEVGRWTEFGRKFKIAKIGFSS